MKCFYDLHIHSDLSPCSNSDMTPNNIVNMCCIKGLSIISVTDHNTAGNILPVARLGEKANIMVVPGIEVTTREEVHVLCYFRNVDDAVIFGKMVYDSLPNVCNNAAIFGEQNIYDECDEITGQLTKLLLNATSYSINEVCSMVKSCGGIMVPAHINKKSNSILSVLGFMPKNLQIDFVEVYQKAETDKRFTEGYGIFYNSDAHQLTDISEAVNFIELDSVEEIFKYMKI